ncbi:MAG TPA: hypothetical protein VE954_12755 [Oligoflexus sp.]|uniref:hypothetical protein n=1 Tax=Oligoflexus sp. TaxID=1971216 RepID=UPI002D297DCE|nr:hypothetical protein [Oligoflexus sp.]HYX33978.1 hypothetical protein [Oligoflexus sp.]
MKMRLGVSGLLLPLVLSACTSKKSEGPDSGTGPTPTPIPSPTPTPAPTKVPPVGGLDACKPEGFEEARSIAEPTLRAAFCLNHARQESCRVSEDYLVACMTLAGDLDPTVTRAHVGLIMKTYEFKE